MTFDAEFLRLLAEGDPRAVEAFVDYFSPRITAVLRFRLHGSDDVDDLRQETFLRTLATLHRVREAERLPGFVHAICRNVWHEHRRRNRRHPTGHEDGGERADGRRGPEATLMRDELITCVNDVLRELPERDHDLLRAVFLDGRDRDDVCRDLGVDRGYLRVLLHRAKERFGQGYAAAVARRGARTEAESRGDRPHRESAG